MIITNERLREIILEEKTKLAEKKKESSDLQEIEQTVKEEILAAVKEGFSFFRSKKSKKDPEASSGEESDAIAFLKRMKKSGMQEVPVGVDKEYAARFSSAKDKDKKRRFEEQDEQIDEVVDASKEDNMKITQKQLREIIKEELESVVDEGFLDNLMGGPGKRAKQRRELVNLALTAGRKLFKDMPNKERPDDEWVKRYKEWQGGDLRRAHGALDADQDPVSRANVKSNRHEMEEMEAEIANMLEKIIAAVQARSGPLKIDWNKVLGIPKRPRKQVSGYTTAYGGAYGDDDRRQADLHGARGRRRE